jgi:hypothetical protein
LAVSQPHSAHRKVGRSRTADFAMPPTVGPGSDTTRQAHRGGADRWPATPRDITRADASAPVPAC